MIAEVGRQPVIMPRSAIEQMRSAVQKCDAWAAEAEEFLASGSFRHMDFARGEMLLRALENPQGGIRNIDAPLVRERLRHELDKHQLLKDIRTIGDFESLDALFGRGKALSMLEEPEFKSLFSDHRKTLAWCEQASHHIENACSEDELVEHLALVEKLPFYQRKEKSYS